MKTKKNKQKIKDNIYYTNTYTYNKQEKKLTSKQTKKQTDLENDKQLTSRIVVVHRVRK